MLFSGFLHVWYMDRRVGSTHPQDVCELIGRRQKAQHRVRLCQHSRLVSVVVTEGTGALPGS